MAKVKPLLAAFFRNRRLLLILALATTAITLVSLVTGARAASQAQRYTVKDQATVVKQVEASKKATWVVASGLLMSDPSKREAAVISSTTSDALLERLVKADVTVETKATLQDIYPSSVVDTASKVTGFGLLFTMVFWGCYMFSRLLLKENKEEEQKLAPTHGGGSIEGVVYTTPDTTFADVAGCEEAVDSLHDMVDFLKNPQRYLRMGVKPPKGALLSGAPGNGKTLLARAMAGECQVPFFTMAGSEFTELYVGAGAKRVRDLFKKVREHESAVIFIDEIDAVARKRSADGNAGNQEAEATLNQLLTEIDGFNNKHSETSIMVIAATNRPDLIDPALTRSGRIERKIEVTNPDRRGRLAILKLHAQGKPLGPEVDLELTAARTPGFSGADMATILNEAGIIALKQDLEFITQDHVDQAIADVAMGRARKSALVTEMDRKITAWHEAGHTLCAFLQPEHDDPVAVSIVPRGPAGGVTWMSGSDDIFLTRRKALSQLVTAFGGRVGEELLLEGEYTQGASSDFQQATNIAYQMVTKYGMTEVGFQVRPDNVAVSNEKVTAMVEDLLREAHGKAQELITAHRPLLAAVVAKLLEKDDVSYRELEELAEAFGVAHERTMESVPVVLTAEGE